jgi:hypothetical protein
MERLSREGGRNLTGRKVPASLQVTPKVSGGVTARLFHMIHDESLVHHVPLPERNQLLELVGEQLAADV